MLLAIASLGCETSSLAERRVQTREDRMNDTLTRWGNSIASRPERLDRTLSHIDRREREYAEKFRRSIEGVGRWYERDVEHMKFREPDYKRKLNEILRGKPENIERSAVILFI